MWECQDISGTFAIIFLSFCMVLLDPYSRSSLDRHFAFFTPSPQSRPSSRCRSLLSFCLPWPSSPARRSGPQQGLCGVSDSAKGLYWLLLEFSGFPGEAVGMRAAFSRILKPKQVSMVVKMCPIVAG